MKKNLLNFFSKYLACIAMLLFTATMTQAQVTYHIGSVGGTATTTRSPIYSCYVYNYTQMIYTASEINTAGASGAQIISKIRFFYASGGTTTTNWNNWTIYMGNTTQATFASTTNWIALGTMTQVFNGAFTPLAGNWVEFTLSSPYIWNGTDNLVIAVDENVAGYSCTAAWRSFTAAANTVINYFSDGTNPDPAAPPTANYGPVTLKPQVQLDMTPNSSCSGIPTGGTTNASANPICSGASLLLNLTGATSGTGITYQWQSADDMAFTSGVTNLGTASTQVTTQTSAKYYRCQVTCSGNTVASTPLLVNINTDNCACVNYCAASATSTSFEKISNITFNTINNNSSSIDGYENFTNLSTSIQAGSIYSFSVSISGGFSADQVIVFIDYNQNGVFTDANETVYTSPLGIGPFSSPITVDVGALTGSTRMRVRLHDSSLGANATSCGTSTYGQVEDYCITISAPTPCAGTPNPGDTYASPSNFCPPGGTANLSLQNGTSGTGVTYNWQSAPASSGPWTNTGVTTASYAAPVISETWFRCIVTCAGNSGTSNPVQVTVGATTNDDPCTATLINAGLSCTYTTGNTTCATNTTGPPTPGCALYLGKDIWYKVVVPYGGSLTVQTDQAPGGFTDSGLALYSSSDNTCSGTFTLIECDDDDSPNGNFSLITRTDFVVGSTVFIRVWKYNDATTGGPINLCVITNISDPCNGTVASVPPTNGTTFEADYQCTDVNEPNFINYFDDAGTPGNNTDDYILLSIDKLTNPDIGEVGDGTFSVQISGASGATWITNPPADYVIDPLFIVMNRWWNVTPNCGTCASSPNIDADANVRFYFTQQDFDDVVSELISGGAAPLDIAQSAGELYMYKINDLPGPYDADPANAHSGVPQAFGYNEDGYWEYEPGGASSDLTWGPVVNDYTGSNYGAEITVVAFSGGGGGGGSNGSGALPIELLYFTGHAEAQVNVIEWATASEKNNQYQIVERSANGLNNWSEVGRKAGAGTSTQTISYKLLDESPLTSGYYRLRAVDFDGQEQLSEVIFIQRSADELAIVNAFPVPVAKNLTLTVNAPFSGDVTVRLSDISGKLISEKTYAAERGINTYEVEMSVLAAGSYQVRVSDGISTVINNIVKQ